MKWSFTVFFIHFYTFLICHLRTWRKKIINSYVWSSKKITLLLKHAKNLQSHKHISSYYPFTDDFIRFKKNSVYKKKHNNKVFFWWIGYVFSPRLSFTLNCSIYHQSYHYRYPENFVHLQTKIQKDCMIPLLMS